MARKINSGGNFSSTVNTHRYNTFRGVDFSKDASMVDDTRSPSAKNIISDTGGFPEKRVGWRILKTLPSPINGIYKFKGMPPVDEGESVITVENYIIHAADKIYSWSGESSDEPVLLMQGVNNAKSHGRYFKDKLCILTGAELLVYDGENCVRADEMKELYTPITVTGRTALNIVYTPRATNSAWEGFENSGWGYNNSTEGLVMSDAAYNALTPRRRIRYSSQSARMILLLDGKAKIGTEIVIKYIPTGEILARFVYTGPHEYGTDTGVYSEGEFSESVVRDFWYAAGYHYYKVYSMISQKYGCTCLCIRIDTEKLTEYTIPIAGIDDIEVEYTESTTENQSDKINKCTVMDVFENRIFYSGNPDYPNTDWYSGVNDPLYIPDINYTDIGSDGTSIVGYLRLGGEQVILKEGGADASIYLRSYQMQSDGSVIFPVKQGINALGAVARDAVCEFLDDPVFLTRNGVYAIAQQDVSSERVLNLRSTRINRKLLDNAKKEDAVMCEWNGNLLLAINGEVYVADAAQRTYTSNKTGTFEYEWYYWDNLPIRVMCEDKGVLLFGTENGEVCRFNNDMKNERGELLPEAYSDNGKAIVAEWSTPLSDDGDFMRLKTMVKKGSGVFLKSYNRSGVKVCIVTDSDFEKQIAEQSAGIFNFDDINFDEFTFNTSPYTVVPFNTKIKKYKAIQVICRNDKLNHAFGIGGIIRRYVVGNYMK